MHPSTMLVVKAINEILKKILSVELGQLNLGLSEFR
jgi:hypothetical protein